MKSLLLIIGAIILTLLPSLPAWAMHNGEDITPYGAYCNRISQYGMHHGILTDEQIEKALHHYYGEKHLDYEIIDRQGRFVKALIKDGDAVVDTIIIDRHSGRIRSIN